MKRSHILAITSYAAKSAALGLNGFIPFDPEATKFPFDGNEVWVGPRHHLEEMETFKQIIPYVLVVRDDKFLVYKRSKSGGEARLHDKVSIGFGGHIDIGDVVATENGESIDVETTIANAAAREITEELKLNETPEFTPYGLILDESDAVGRVHLGVVMIAHITGMALANEEQIDLVGFKTIENLNEMNLESWSRILIDALVKVSNTEAA